MTDNIILNADSYKASHYLQYPPRTTVVSSYIEARGGDYPQSVFFGLQMYLRETLSRRVTADDIEEAASVLGAHGLPFNRAGWQHIVEAHDGRLPVEVKAVPEGTVLPVRNVLVQVRNTDPKVPWLTSYVETSMLRAVWYPTTVATRSWYCREIIRTYLAATADDASGLPFKLHDFGARGAASGEAAAIGGAAHLVNFQGTDTLAGIMAARNHYGADMPGFSIPAAEHSTITAWGDRNEQCAFENMLEQFAKPGAVVAVVSDSYDLWHAVDELWGNELKARVQDSGATVVVRPDSGDPVTVVTETVERLIKHFGCTINTKGYRVLPDCIRVIQGDGVSPKTIEAILAAMQARKQSTDNVAFGMGGELLQKVNRDTLQFAMKASAIKIGGVWRDVYKEPAQDSGKNSKRGLLALVADEDDGFRTVREQELGGRENLLQTVFKDGELTREWTFDDIRERAIGA